MINDEYFLAALRLASGNDPIPGHVSAAARDVFELRVPRAVTAMPAEGATARGVRGADGPRMVRFVAAGLTFDLEVTVGDGLIDVVGQVFPHSRRGQPRRRPHPAPDAHQAPGRQRPVRGHRPASRLAQRGLPPARSGARPDQVGARPPVTRPGRAAPARPYHQPRHTWRHPDASTDRPAVPRTPPCSYGPRRWPSCGRWSIPRRPSTPAVPSCTRPRRPAPPRRRWWRCGRWRWRRASSAICTAPKSTSGRPSHRRRARRAAWRRPGSRW